jgi:DNA-binding CsgD family transcriptional regulator
MSWLVGTYIKNMAFILSSNRIHSDDYNNALLIQKCIENLNKQKLLSEIELTILEAVFEGYNYSEVSRILKIDRQTVSQIFDNVTDRIAYIMGDEFTDASFLDRLETIQGLESLDVSDLFKRGIIKKTDEDTWN